MYNKKLVFAASFISILFFGVAITTLGSLVPQLQNAFALNDKDIGALFSILPIGILLGALIFGPIGDRFGYRILLAFACFSMGIGFIGIAYSGTLLLLNVCVFLFGFGGGIINGATSGLVADISDENKGANLSILGVFFAIGALGMPFILGSLEHRFSYQSILTVISVLTIFTGFLFLSIQMPAAKQQSGISAEQIKNLLRKKLLWLIAFFLFFQSAYEGILNNWSPTYLRKYLAVPDQQALYALSLGVVGMTAMRLLLGSVLKKTPSSTIWTITFVSMGLGVVALFLGHTYWIATTGFILIGISLAAGFPIMLGYIGETFQSLSGTAFSIAFSIALVGNSIINYSIGWVSENWGIRYLLFFAAFMFLCQLFLCISVLRVKSSFSKADV